MNYERGRTSGRQQAEAAPIFNIEAEAALLGALMIDNRLIDEALGKLAPDDFYEPAHQRIFKVICLLHSSDTIANPVSLIPYFAGEEPIASGADAIPWAQYLAQLTGSGAALIGARAFMQQVQDLSIMRRMSAVMLESAAALSQADGEKTLSERAADIAARILDTAERTAPVKVLQAKTLAGRVRERRERWMEGTSLGARCKTVEDLHALLGALAPGQMTVLGGRPSMGKSVLAQSVGWGCSAEGHPTLYVSCEMDEYALAMRLMSDATHGMSDGVPYRKIQRNTTDVPDIRAMEEAERRLARIPFYAIVPDRPTIEEFESIVAMHVARLAREGKHLELVICDYIQLLSSAKKFDSRSAEISYISGRLLRVAKRHKLHVLALSQLSRAVDERPGHRPQNSDLRESGRLEEDADNVIFVNREEYWLEREKKQEGDKGYEEWRVEYEMSRDRMDIIAGKVRAGLIGVKRVKFYGDYQAVRGSQHTEPFMGGGDVYLHGEDEEESVL